MIGAFFGFFLLVLLLICCFRIFRGGGGGDDDSDTSSQLRRRRRRRIVPLDPYPLRPDANLTFVGGGNQRETKVVITKTQRYFIRPQPAVIRQTRTVRATRKERIVVVGD